MRTLTKIVLFILIILTFHQPLTAQTDNPFLERSFWREKPSLKIVQEKIKEGHSLTATNDRGYDALSNAIINTGNLAIAKLLVEHGANIHKKIQRSGRTPVFWAVYKDNLELLKYLVSKGAKTDIIDEYGNSLIMYAASSGASDQGIYDFLLKGGLKLKGVIDDEYGRTPLLMYAGRIKNMEMIDYFLKHGLSIHDTDKDGNGVFNYAARTKNKTFLEELIKRGASPKANPKTGENAFTFATRGRGGELNLDFLKYLESLGLDPTAKTQQGSTCLNNIAFSEKKPEIFKYFIEKGVDPNGVDSNGSTPLMRASYRNSKEIIDYLLSVSKNINHQNNDGYTALSYAIRRNTPEMVAYLIEKGARVDVMDRKQNDLGTQLVDSYRSRDMKVFHKKMDLLIKHGYDPQKASVQNGNCLLQVAVRNGNLQLIEEVIKMKIPINYKNDEGYTPLHVAAMTAKDDRIVKKLLKAGADKSIVTEFGETVFDLAAENEVLKAHKINVDFLK